MRLARDAGSAVLTGKDILALNAQVKECMGWRRWKNDGLPGAARALRH